MALQNIGKVSKNKIKPSIPNPVEKNRTDGDSMQIPHPGLPDMLLFTTTTLDTDS